MSTSSENAKANPIIYVYMSGIGKQKQHDVQNIKYTVSINEILYGWETKLYAVPERAEGAVAGFVAGSHFWPVILLHPVVAVRAATGFINMKLTICCTRVVDFVDP